MRNRTVITGIGVVTSAGIGKDQFWNSVVKGKSGIKRITSFDISNFETKIGGEIQKFNLKEHFPEMKKINFDRFVEFGLAATKLAVIDSNLDLNRLNPGRVGVYVGSGLGGMMYYEKQVELYGGCYPNRVHPSAVSKITPNAISANIAMAFQFFGPNLTISTACSSSNHAIGLGSELIESGKADVVIAGGTEASLIPVNFASFDNMRVMSRCNETPEEASRPFDNNRDGFVMGEGAGMLILERREHAQRRSAKIYGEVAGYGASCGAYHMVMPRGDGEDEAAAIISAIKDSGIKKEKISYINAHGTATRANDISETKAIKKVFGDYAYKIPISSTKPIVGHMIGAAGAIGVICASLSLKTGLVHFTKNYRYRDPLCDLDYIPDESRQIKIDAALINSFGFGNNNACIILKRAN